MENGQVSNERLEAALEYLKLGKSVIPVNPKTKKPFVPWVKYQEKLANPTTVRRWWEKWPNASVAIITGRVSNLVVIDFDSPDALDNFEATISQLPVCITQTTGRGCHVFFEYPELENIGNRSNVIENVDIRGEGGYVIVAPSIHASGKRYTWGKINPLEHGFTEAADMHPDIIRFCVSNTVGAKGADKAPEGWVEAAMSGVKKGSRNQTCAALVGHFFGQGQNKAWVRAMMLTWNKGNSPPMDEKDVLRTIASIERKEGAKNLSSLLGIDILSFEILQYPDSTAKYRLCVRERGNYIILEAEDITSVTRFRNRFLQLTNFIIPKITGPRFWKLMNKVLSDAEVIHMGEEETKAGAIRTALLNAVESQLEDGTMLNLNDRPDIIVKEAPLVWEGKILLRLEVARAMLQFTGIKINGQKELGQVFRRLGFEPAVTRLNGDLVRSWAIDCNRFSRGNDKLQRLLFEQSGAEGDE